MPNFNSIIQNNLDGDLKDIETDFSSEDFIQGMLNPDFFQPWKNQFFPQIETVKKSSTLSFEDLQKQRQINFGTEKYPSIDWTKKNIEEVYYDGSLKMYFVSILTEYETFGEKKDEIRFEALQDGVSIFFDFYNKKKDNIKDVLSSGIFNAYEFYIPPRPTAKIKFLIGITDENFKLKFQKFEENEEEIDNEEPNIKIFNTSYFSKKINELQNLFIKYKSDYESFFGFINDYNPQRDIDRLEQFKNNIIKFIEFNGYIFDDSREDMIEIGFKTNVYGKTDFEKLLEDASFNVNEYENNLSFVETYEQQHEFLLSLEKQIDQKFIDYIEKDVNLDYDHGVAYGSETIDLNKQQQYKEIYIFLSENRSEYEKAKQYVDYGREKYEKYLKDGSLSLGPDQKTGVDKITHISFNRCGYFKDLKVGLSSLRSKVPMNDKKILTYIFHIDEILESSLKFEKFINTYIYPDPVILYTDPSFDGGSDGYSSYSLSLKDSILGIIDDEYESDTEKLAKGSYFTGLYDDLLKKTYKTRKSVQEEWDKLTDTGFRKGIHNLFKDAGRKIDDFNKVQGEQFSKEIDGMLKDAYGKFLNKYGIENLAKVALACLAQSGFDIGLNVKLPTVPQLELPDNLSISDWLADFVIALEKLGMEMIKDVIMQIIYNLLDAIKFDCIDFPGDLFNFGKENLESFMSESKSDHMKNMVTNLFANDQTSDKQQAIKEDLGLFFRDVSSLLTLKELCDLVTGKMTQEIKEVIISILKTKYSETLDFFIYHENGLEDILKYIGDNIDKEMCSKISVYTVGSVGGENCLCESGEDLRRNWLNMKNISEEDINEQVQKANDRRDKLAEDLKELLKDPVKKNLPPYFCKTNSDGSKTEGIMGKSHPSLDFMVKRTVNTMLDPIHMSFNSEVKDISQFFVQDVEEKISIPVLVNNRINPELKRRIANGEFDEEDLKNDDDWKETYEVQITDRQVLPILYDNLFSFEKDGFWSRSYDKEAGYIKYSFDIPIQINDKQKESIKKVTGKDLSMSNPWRIDFCFPAIYNSETKYKINILKYYDGIAEPILYSSTKIDSNNFSAYFDYYLSDVSKQSYHSKQEEVFSKVMINGWKALGAHPGFVQENYFKEKVFNKVFGDIISIFTKEAAKSVFFKMKENTNQLNDSTIEIPNYMKQKNAFIEFVNFTPQPSIEQAKCGIDPSLLNINNLKKAVMNNYNSSCPPEIKNDCGLSEDMSPIEKSLMMGVLLTLTKVYIAEFYILALMPSSTFRISNDHQVILTNFIKDHMLMDLENIEVGFKTKFLSQILKLYISETQDKSLSGEEVLEVYVKLLIPDFLKQFERVIKLSPKYVEDIYNSKKINIIEIPKNKDEKRFGQFHLNSENTFSVKNGEFFIERYIRVDDYSKEEFLKNNENLDYVNVFWDEINNSLRNDYLKNVCNIESFSDYINYLKKNDHGDYFLNFKLNQIFKNIKFGMRLVYLMPKQEESIPITFIEYDDESISMKEKCFNLEETFVANDSLPYRPWYTIPVCSFEQDYEGMDKRFSQVHLSEDYKEKSVFLLKELEKKDVYNVIFNDCVNINDISSLVTMYCCLSIMSIPGIDKIFYDTKEKLVRDFDMLTNGNGYDYVQEDSNNKDWKQDLENATELVKRCGGLKIPSISAKFAFKAPFYILKGLAELIDPNIKIAKIIADMGKLSGVCLPVPPISLGLLPINLIPPPFGIGPPLSGLGFAYLALNLGDAISDALEDSLGLDGGGSGKVLDGECEDIK
ncbi:hypothetical protein M0R19_04400 [Candidatus Pacearchaeota archaeon]|nr:hypothetical protein [Candidatus Pacearchaeota archaeon]